MSDTYLTFSNNVPQKIGQVTYQIANAGKSTKITVQQGATVQHPTQGESPPWNVSYQISDAKQVLAIGEQAVSDPAAAIGLGIDLRVNNATAPSDQLDAGWTRLGDLPSGWGETGAVRDAVLSFDMQLQEQTQWCWAAVSSSVARFWGSADPEYAQCKLANWKFQQTQCCGSGDGHACNRPAPLLAPLRHVGHLRTASTGRLDAPAIRAEIDAGRPIAVGIGWDRGGGHAVAITGYAALDGVPWVRVQDPWDTSTAHVPLHLFPQGGTWHSSYTTQA